MAKVPDEESPSLEPVAHVVEVRHAFVECMESVEATLIHVPSIQHCAKSRLVVDLLCLL